VTTALVFGQILVGATMRHTGAGLAIPDFPLMVGHVIPDHWSARIAIHFAHRTGAVVVATAAVSTAVYIRRQY
jgi:cytochrome c oxidase assembly protein subunit 15